MVRVGCVRGGEKDASFTPDRRVLAAMAESDIDLELDPEEIRDWLRKSWDTEVWIDDSRTTVGEHMIAYHAG
jgi:hypothetical protein